MNLTEAQARWLNRVERVHAIGWMGFVTLKNRFIQRFPDCTAGQEQQAAERISEMVGV